MTRTLRLRAARLLGVLLLGALPALLGIAPGQGFGNSIALPVSAATPPGSDWLSVQNLDGLPSNERLILQRIAFDFNSDFTKKNAIARVTNISGAPVTVAATIEGGDASNFVFRFDSDKNFTLQPGASQDIDIQMVTGADANGQGGNGNVRGPRSSSLVFRSTGKQARTIELRGFMMPREQGDFEPTLQQLLDLFGYTTQAVRPNSSENLKGDNLPSVGKFRGGVYAADGDEVLSTNWRRAGAGKMYVRQLAALHKREPTAPEDNTPRIEIGGGTLRHCPDDFQSFMPRNRTCDGPAEMEVEPGLNSSFTIGGTGKTTTSDAGLLSGRVWPLRDGAGYLIPNTYIFAQDFICASAEPDCTYANYDYQDDIWYITNMKPADTKQDPAIPAKRPGDPSLVLDFGQAVGGTLNDKDGQGSGFATTHRNRDDRNAPQVFPPAESYVASNIDLDTAQGLLRLTATGFTNENREDLLENGLCVPFDSRSDAFTISTRLRGPFDAVDRPGEHMGLMYGPHQGTYIRLTVGTQISGTVEGKPWIQLAYEVDNTLTQVGPLISLPNVASLQTLDLTLKANPATGQVEAFYRANDGLSIPMPQKIQLAAPNIGRFFDPQAKGCVMATSKGGSNFAALYDRFAIELAADESGLPNVNAGPDQKVNPSATVTLQGTATDSAGAPLTGNWQQISGPPVTLQGTGNARTFQAPASFAVLGFAFGASDAQNRSRVDTVQIRVGDEPIAGLQLDGSGAVEVGQVARFNAITTAGEQPIVYEWDFGDGSPKQIGGANVGYRYGQPGNFTVSVKATNPAGNATATKAVAVVTPLPNFALRYDIGSTSDRQVGGVTWKRDNNPQIYNPSVSAENRDATAISGISASIYDAALYKSYRGAVGQNGTFNINIPLNSQIGVPAGTAVPVEVKLHFAEVYWGGSAGVPSAGGAGKRVFDISIENVKRVENYDIYSAAQGADRARIERFSATVSDGTLSLSFFCEVDNVSVAGIEVLKLQPSQPDNSPPSPWAGNDRIAQPNEVVALQGSATDPDADAVTLEWAQLSGPNVELGGSGGARSFTATQGGSYVFRLTATDAAGLSASDEVTIVVPLQDLAPSVSAGPDQSAISGQQVTLQGSASDPEGGTVTLLWQQVSGPPATLSNPTAAQPTFTPGANGTYIFNLTASDPGGRSSTDTVAITVTDPGSSNLPPTVEAGADRSSPVGQVISLLGQGADPNGDALTYTWQQTSGPTVALEGSGATRSFTPSQPGTYVFTVFVSDPGGLQGADSVTIVVREQGNLVPAAYIPLTLRP
jgi:PKD repeat protein